MGAEVEFPAVLQEGHMAFGNGFSLLQIAIIAADLPQAAHELPVAAATVIAKNHRVIRMLFALIAERYIHALAVIDAERIPA